MSLWQLHYLHFKGAGLGDANACGTLGAVYATGDFFGMPVKQDLARAFGWYQRAAKKGVTSAQYELGLMYLLGEGVTRSEEKGVEWLRIAAGDGYGEAIRILADGYSSGVMGIELDEKKAQEWQGRLEEHLRRHPEQKRSYEDERH